MLDFLSDEAVDDAWIIASYLSDADHLLSASFSPTRVQMVKGSHGPETLLQSAAACVSVRGVLFGNSQPSTSRFSLLSLPADSSFSGNNFVPLRLGGIRFDAPSFGKSSSRPDATRWFHPSSSPSENPRFGL